MFVRKTTPRVEFVPVRSATRHLGPRRRKLFGLSRDEERLNTEVESPVGGTSGGVLEETLDGVAEVTAGLSSPSPPPPSGPMGLVEAMEAIGLPQLPGSTPEEEVLELLRYAAEVEHGLMAQYLYAMYSSRSAGLRGILKSIAIEEMGHLITVQNLLLAGGATPHLVRYDWSGETFQPFPFRLEPVSRVTIAKYTACEMPDPDSPHFDPPQHALIQAIVADAWSSAGMAPARIGLLYAKIYWSLRKDDLPLADPAQEPWDGFPVDVLAADPNHAGRHVGTSFFKGNIPQQARPDDWQGNHETVIVTVVKDRDNALEAVSDISEQGEGFGGSLEGHFDRFVEAYIIAQQQADLAHPVPVDPWYGPVDPPGRDPVDKITSVDGEGFARLGDQLYELVLLSTGLYHLLPATIDPLVRSGIPLAAVDTMTKCLAKVGRRIVDVERQQSVAAVAHLCFTRPTEQPETASEVLARAIAVVDLAAATADGIAQTTTNPQRKGTAEAVAAALRNGIRPLFEQVVI